jgi:hypothetical protein
LSRWFATGGRMYLEDSQDDKLNGLIEKYKFKNIDENKTDSGGNLIWKLKTFEWQPCMNLFIENRNQTTTQKRKQNPNQKTLDLFIKKKIIK